MALSDAEIAKCKSELGYNVLDVGAEPYISIVALFEQVIQDNVLTGATTTSSTAVTASATPTPSTITVASATGIAQGNVLVVDVDSRQEKATVQSLSGSDITLLLSKAHTGTYPVAVESGETLVRETLRKIADVKTALSENYGAGALKKVDEIEFFAAGGKTYFGTLGENLRFWRNELAAQLGVRNLWDVRRAGGRRLSVY